MRLFEFADAKASLELWKIVSDSVWKAISVQAQEQERREQEHSLKQKKKPKVALKVKQPPKPSIANPQPSKAKKTSAQAIQSQKVQSKTLKSKPKTVLPQSTSVISGVPHNAVKTRSLNYAANNSPNSVASVQRQLDPLAYDPIAKRKTS